MSVDLDSIFSRGGKRLVDLLDYGVRAVETDLLFVFLVREYRELPTARKAVALFDGFCAPGAPARLSVPELLPPYDLALEVALRGLRRDLERLPAPLPPKYLFDALDLRIRARSKRLRAVRRDYRIRRTPSENLPGGRMSAGQRRFVDAVWEPLLRPRLVAAGFRRVGSIA